MRYKKIAVISSHHKKAINYKRFLIKKYNFLDFDHSEDIDLLIALGGDGFMIRLLHENYHIPIYGINFGTVGFLMNQVKESEDLIKRIELAENTTLYPIKMKAIDKNNKTHILWAMNEVSLIRQSNQTAKIKISINDKIRIEKLCSDGVLVSTEAGSAAYNFSVHGPIIPFGSNLINLMPICPFRPRNWKGALLPSSTIIKFIISDYKLRPVSATADYNEIRNIKEVEIREDREIKLNVLFDLNHSLEERILVEQFS